MRCAGYQASSGLRSRIGHLQLGLHRAANGWHWLNGAELDISPATGLLTRLPGPFLDGIAAVFRRIAELLEYPTLRAAMGEQGRWEALREGWPERARETVGVYLEAMESRGRGP